MASGYCGFRDRRDVRATTVFTSCCVVEWQATNLMKFRYISLFFLESQIQKKKYKKRKYKNVGYLDFKPQHIRGPMNHD